MPFSFIDETYQSTISYLITSGYYLEEEAIANDELVPHTPYTKMLVEQAYQTKEFIDDNESLELVGYNDEKKMFYVQWYCEASKDGYDNNGYQYIYFTV